MVLVIAGLTAFAAIVFALVYQNLTGMVVYDSNFKTFHDTLTPEQRGGIVRTVRGMVGLYVMLLVVTNALWAAAACLLISHMKRLGNPAPIQDQQAASASL